MSNNLRHYATIAEVQEFADVTSTDDAEFQERIEQAEELIDQYVGYQEKAVQGDFRGTVSAASGTTVTDTNPSSQLHIIDDYFINCVIEIIGGTGIGQVRFITASSYDNRSVTVDTAWDTALDTTSFYRIYQLAKFPRACDVYARADGRKYYKVIPNGIKRAVAAQMQFMINKGDDYFGSDDLNLASETVGNYSYSKGGAANQSEAVKLVAPRARAFLRGIKNSGGRMVVDNPTSL